jgi:hypothetical protein
MPSHGSILLGEVAQHLASVDIACNFCPRVGKASIARLMQEHGPDMPIPTLLREDCARERRSCGRSVRVQHGRSDSTRMAYRERVPRNG